MSRLEELVLKNTEAQGATMEALQAMNSRIDSAMNLINVLHRLVEGHTEVLNALWEREGLPMIE